jgi:hypothetical protein
MYLLLLLLLLLLQRWAAAAAAASAGAAPKPPRSDAAQAGVLRLILLLQSGRCQGLKFPLRLHRLLDESLAADERQAEGIMQLHASETNEKVYTMFAYVFQSLHYACLLVCSSKSRHCLH